MAAAAKYAHEEASESERPLKVCAEAGRKCVRNIQQYPVLSAEWIALVDSLKQLTRLVQLEGRMPANTKVGEAQGRNQDSEGTLWDQETHENAIRILVEEAKVNLCLRMMIDYKDWQYNADRKAQTIAECRASYDLNDMQLEQKCRMFEESLGVLLMKAFQHVETLQLMDIPMLIEHLAKIYHWSNQAKASQPDLAPFASKVQETMVTFYFSSLMKHSEALNNGELLAKSREHNLVQLAAYHVLSHQTECPNEVKREAAAGFAALCDNEDFSTTFTEFFKNEHGQLDVQKKDTFLLLEGVVNEVLAESADKRRELRPLTDFFVKLKRAYGVS